MVGGRLAIRSSLFVLPYADPKPFFFFFPSLFSQFLTKQKPALENCKEQLILGLTVDLWKKEGKEL